MKIDIIWDCIKKVHEYIGIRKNGIIVRVKFKPKEKKKVDPNKLAGWQKR